ncbi:uncharacterized protein LOC106173392 [Lingula anatina]|uniref:Uncharacterized protein LOC106173392 n=1 Tax=Lingula anatina TaxID=7574 RepID=A0A1S3JIL7_LINAN|nr:uncharacterized protein LOC106173392 [Lingula anatina]|eukprot:XP_013409976.1 uncharacterized protein LOC106173392 [Lingula anatina]
MPDKVWTQLHEAVRRGNIKIVKSLLGNGSEDINVAGTDPSCWWFINWTPLHVAAHCGNLPITRLLVDSMADVGCRTEAGKTALHLASEQGHFDMVLELLRLKLKLNSRDVFRHTALHWASQGGHKEIVKLLLSHKSKVHLKNTAGNTCLHLTAERGHVDVADLLIGSGASVNDVNHWGESPLHLACKGRHVKMINFLVYSRANLLLRTKDNKVPAEMTKDSEISSQLVNLRLVEAREVLMDKAIGFVHKTVNLAQCRFLVRRNVTDVELDDLEYAYVRDGSEQRHRMLQLWRQRMTEPSVDHLIELMKENQLKLQSEQLEEWYEVIKGEILAFDWTEYERFLEGRKERQPREANETMSSDLIHVTLDRCYVTTDLRTVFIPVGNVNGTSDSGSSQKCEALEFRYVGKKVLLK